MGRRAALALGAVIAIGGAALFVLVALKLARDPDVARSIADETFTVGDAVRLAAAIEEGGALLFQDPLEQGGDGRGRDIWVLHEGDDPEAGWSAVEVRSRNSDCALDWDRRAGRFRKECPDNRRYPAEVKDGEVVVDLREGG